MPEALDEAAPLCAPLLVVELWSLELVLEEDGVLEVCPLMSVELDVAGELEVEGELLWVALLDEDEEASGVELVVDDGLALVEDEELLLWSDCALGVLADGVVEDC